MRRFFLLLLLLSLLALAAPASRANSPVADAGPDFSTFRNARFWLSANMSSDPDGDVLTFSWFQVSGPTANGNLPSNETIGLSLSAVGTYVFQVTVSDGNASDSDAVLVTVINRAPFLGLTSPTANFVNVEIGDFLVFSALFIDVDGDVLTYSWRVNGVLEFVGANASDYTPFFPGTGTYLVEVTASDGFADRTHSWTVAVLEMIGDTVPSPPSTAPLLLSLAIAGIIVCGIVASLFIALRGLKGPPRRYPPAVLIRRCPRCRTPLTDGPYCPGCGATIR